jgi:S-(hydroxymethyl)glutathione dehydrogenase/alcohol dehydrogenase
MEVRAAITEGSGAFSIETIGLESPEHGEVLLAIKATGVCHTDWDSLRWGKRLALGHEGAGEVLAVGDGVSRIAPSDRAC